MDGNILGLIPMAGGSVIAFDGQFLAKMITHTVTFLIFMWVLKRYAWGPLLQILDSRKESIESQFAKIEDLKVEAERIEAKYEAKMKDIDAEARRHVQAAVADGQRVKDEIIARAREEADDLREKQERLLHLEVAKARIEMRDEIVALTIAATEKLVGQTVDSEGHRRLVGEFIESVQALPTEGNGRGDEEN